MSKPRIAPSRYARADRENLLVRRWAATLLLHADLESAYSWRSVDRSLLALFDPGDMTKKDLDDAKRIGPWLEGQLETCRDAVIDEGDVFAVNTRRLARDLRLDELELALLRFALMLGSTLALREAAAVVASDLSEIEVSDMASACLGLDPDAVHEALAPHGRLRRSGLIPVPTLDDNEGRLADHLPVPAVLTRHVLRGPIVHDDRRGSDGPAASSARAERQAASGRATKAGASSETMLFARAPRSRLERRDLRHLEPALGTLVDYLRMACRKRVAGANILLWGPPGTGKTELARWLARATRRTALEIGTRDDLGRPWSALDRLESFRLCQAIVSPASGRFVIYDEIEDVLSDDTFADKGFKGVGPYTKSFFTTLLETNPVPTVWITNTLDGVDPAYLRRFDMVQRLEAPDTRAKRRIAARGFATLPVGEELIEAIAANRHLTPAHLGKASRICRLLALDERESVERVTRLVLDNDLVALDAERLAPSSTDRERGRGPTLEIDPGVLNTDVDIEELLADLAHTGGARLCLYGAPGTGKSALAAEIARRLGRPLLVRHADAILDAYVGGTEKNIAAAFREARETDAVLVFDEVDSFLQDRLTAHRHWEVAQVNQFLTSLEHHEGLVVCTTNLMAGLDPATLRRFDFKIRFDWLTPTQALRMLELALAALGQSLGAGARRHAAERLAGARLAPGDFAVALRQASIRRAPVSATTLVESVLAEGRFRESDGGGRGIGFVPR